MIRFILKRLKDYLPIFLLVIIFTFLIIHLIPGDPVRTMLGDKATIQQVESMRRELNLDKPLIVQFKIWITGIATLDFGESFFWKEPILELLKTRIEPTLILSIIGITLSILIGIPLGITSAKHYHRLSDNFFSIVTLVSISIPAFILAIVFIELFSVQFRIFPTSGYDQISKGGFINAIYQLLLPGIVLGIMYSGQIARMTKNTLLDVMEEDYLRTARSQGIKENVVINIYAFINAIPSVIVVIGFTFTSLFGGSAVIEQIFNIPGIGSLLITAILNRDYPTIQGTLLFIAMMIFTVNMIVDIINILINPKARFD